MHKLFIYAKLFHIGLFIINLSCLILLVLFICLVVVVSAPSWMWSVIGW